MPTSETDIHITRLGREKFGALARKARRFGMSPANYVKRLVEEDLEISNKAKTTSFDEMLTPGRNVDEAELDALIDRARNVHHAKSTKKR